MMKRRNFWVHDETMARLARACASIQMKVAEAVREALREWLDRRREHWEEHGEPGNPAEGAGR